VTGSRAGNAAIAGRVTVQPITDKEFHSFQELIHRLVGISLSSAKRDLLVNRLSPRMRELGIATFGAYFRRIEEDEDERIHMLDRISTNETQFFREPRHFEFLEQTVYPDWIARAEAGKIPRKIKVWSSACSTGEEPYSLAMSLLSNFGPSWSISILATDISTRALAKAENATWSMERASHIPPAMLKTFMLRGTRSQEGKMKAGPEIRSIIEFRRFNLNDESYPYRGAFDLVFCRNVLIYFNVAGRQRVIDQLASCLAPGGLLFLGHAETASGATTKLRPVVPTVYRLIA
jgi:chemotaxis protein methyltransferase CheR